MKMRLNEGKLPKDLYSWMHECLDEFVSEVENEIENGEYYDTDTEALIEAFKQDYKHAPQNHLFYDFYDTLKTIKTFSFDQIYNLYRPSQDEFDENALFRALDKLVLNSFVDQNRSVFEELADSMNELYGMSVDVKNKSKTNYESLRRNKRKFK